MTRTWLVLVAAGAALALAAYLLLGNRGPQRSAEEAFREAAERKAAESAEPAPLPPTALAPGAKPPEGERPRPTGPRGSVDMRTLPKGTLVVIVVGTDDQPLPSDALRVEVGPARGGREWPRTPVFGSDPETKSWQAHDVPAGPVEVRVTGDHVVERAVTVQHAAEGGEPVKIPVEAAGAIHYVVTLADGTVPAEVTLSLLDEKERQLPARFQARSATMLTTPRTATSVKLGPEGVVMGVKPGRYVLRAVSPTENTADTKVEVVAGETAELAVTIRA